MEGYIKTANGTTVTKAVKLTLFNKLSSVILKKHIITIIIKSYQNATCTQIDRSFFYTTRILILLLKNFLLLSASCLSWRLALR